MRKELIIKSRSLGGSTDLTLLAPIKPGLIPSLDTVTYKTRAKTLLKTLNSGRTSSHEYSLFRPFSDAVERVGKIHSVRVAIVEPDKILLSVTFDGSWGSYLRVLWQKVGPLLDIIFCNTVDYVDAYSNTYEEWAAWVDKVQIETNFFYGMPGLTVDDVQYLRKTELAVRRNPESTETDLEVSRTRTVSAEESAWIGALSSESTLLETGRQGLRALSFLHRLTSMYLPGTPDGAFLHRATRDLLKEFMGLVRAGVLRSVYEGGKLRFDEQIAWLDKEVEPRVVPPRPTERPVYDRDDVQGGIVTAYEGVTHGCLLLVAFKGTTGLAKFLGWLAKTASRDGQPPVPGMPFLNIHFSYEGLRAAGLSEEQLALFPEDFRQGMEARASVLGDFRINHPRRWRLPERNFGARSDKSRREIELSAVHAVIQMRFAGSGDADDGGAAAEENLYNRVTELVSAHDTLLDVLHIQPLVRHLNEAGEVREHFGFTDGNSQPVIDPADQSKNKVYDRNLAQLGEFLLGYANEADAAPDESNTLERSEWLRNGTFLVVRKLSQDVERLLSAVGNASKTEKGEIDEEKRELILAKMMGRKRTGESLVTAAPGNDFDYEDDKDGALCPFHAHIRRANPRRKDGPEVPSPPGGRTPRIMRRSMSYGPLFKEIDPAVGDSPGQLASTANKKSSRDDAPNESPRGLVFMAYNASISEQFEVIQRWISGGNSTAGYSGQSDPFMGLDPNGQQRYFRFEDKGQIYRVALDGTDTPLEESRPFVRLQWGAYLFTPSITALRKLQYAAMKSDGTIAGVWSAKEGLEAIKALQQIECIEGPQRAADAWKAALEDPDAQEAFASASIWAAIRDHHDGVIRTPYGTIVASPEHVMEVLGNDDVFSVCGYHDRMKHSIGEIYLGLDDKGPGCPYHQQSERTNAAILDLKERDAFDKSREYAEAAISAFVEFERIVAKESGEERWELNLNAKEVVDKVLEALCRYWFGLPLEKAELQPGGARWDWASGDPTDPPRYPGNFSAPSRYLFQPRPGATVESFGRDYGQSLTVAFRQWVATHRGDNGLWKAVSASEQNSDAQITKAIFAAFPDREQDDLVARTLVGALMGFLPTVDGNLRLSMNEWLRDGTFWSLRSALANRGLYPVDEHFENAKKLLEPMLLKTMQLRPSPELVWRTVTCDHKLGDVALRPGDQVVVSIVSATHQYLEEGDYTNVHPIFGGDRQADVHPTHSCPGKEAAIGVLLGILSAFLEVTETMRPSPAPLAFTLEGPIPKQELPVQNRSQPQIETAIDTPKRFAKLAKSAKTGKPRSSDAKKPWLLLEGDSWFKYFQKPCIATYLVNEHDFLVNNLALATDWLRNIGDNQLDLLCATLKDMTNRDHAPVAILLSAGGNDVVKRQLVPLLTRNANGLPELVEAAVAKAIDVDLRDQYIKIFSRITKECERQQGGPIPIFFHGYDYPIADNRGAFGVVGDLFSWLYPYIGSGDIATRTEIMKDLIDRLNNMQKSVASMKEFASRVFHVDLRGTLSSELKDGAYKNDWANELHPTDKGFEKVTKKFDDILCAKLLELQTRADSKTKE